MRSRIFLSLFCLFFLGCGLSHHEESLYNTLEDGPFDCTFQYDGRKVLRIYPPQDQDLFVSNGIGLFLSHDEEISFYGKALNTFDMSEHEAMWKDFLETGRVSKEEYEQEMKESWNLFFVNKVANCRKVPVGGYFGLYYECADGMRAGAKRPGRGYVYLDYDFSGEPKNLDLFKQILRTFKTLPPEAVKTAHESQMGKEAPDTP